MNFTNLYQRLLPYWGSTVNFADGALLEHKNPFLALGKLKGQQNTSAATEHFYSESFSKAWQKAEEKVPKEDALGKLLLWSMYLVFQRHAQQAFSEGKTSFTPENIPVAEIEEQFLKNLNEPGYEEEKAAFEAV